MLDKDSKGIIAEGDPKYLRDYSQNPFVKKFFNPRAEYKAAA
jgi:phospholipid/cholesterol/gamma-HCH transport system ATP-binding protein